MIGRRGALSVALVGLLAGCGTTVPLSARSSTSQGGDQLSTVTTEPTSGALPGATDQLPGTSSTGGTLSGRVSLPGAVPSTAASAPGVVPNVAASQGPLRVGLLYTAGADQAAKTLGISGVATGDVVAQANAIAAYLNAHGGVLGRQVKIVPYALSTSDNANNPAAAQEAACTSFTQDSHVAAVVSYNNLFPSFLTCLHRAGVYAIDDAQGPAETTMSRLPSSLFQPGGLLPGRLYRNVVEALAASGFLTRTSKVGVFSYDDKDSSDTINDFVKPALARVGITSVTVEQTTNDAAGISNNSAIVTKFAAMGVDRIIPVGASPLFLMEAAEAQHYYPRYGLNSGFGPGALFETAAPADQLKGSQSFGFQPYSDIGKGNRGGPVNSNETLCLKIMKDAGQGSTAATTELLQVQLCDTLFFLRDAAAKGAGLSGPQVTAGAALLGTSWPSPATFGSAFPDHRPDGVGSYRLAVYDDSCSCYQYQGGRHPTT